MTIVIIWLAISYSLALAWIFLGFKNSGAPTEDMYGWLITLFIFAPLLIPIALWAGAIWKFAMFVDGKK